MTQELEKFREKYPGYDDIGDIELSKLLANKYPDAYGDLPGKVINTMYNSGDITDGQRVAIEELV